MDLLKYRSFFRDHCALLLVYSALGLINVPANSALKIFTVIFFLFLFGYDAASDLSSDQFGQMTRQQQL